MKYFIEQPTSHKSEEIKHVSTPTTFKMPVLHFVKDSLKEKGYMCNVDLKDAYFCIPLNHSCKKYV